MYKIQYRFFIICFAFLSIFEAFAAPSAPTDDDGGGLDPNPGLPIDEKIIFLLVAGFVLGAYVIYNKHYKTKSN